MAPPVRLPQIPTVSHLYKDGTLHSPSSNTSLPTPSASLNAKVSLIRTSITNLATTCIVNAANTSLLGGGGVDGAIHSAAGPSLLRECRTLNGCPTGSAKITSAHALPSSYIIHAVGPIYNSHENAADKLRSCYRTSLELALEKAKETGQDASIAFSCLSTGIYGYPSGEAAEVACGEVRKFLEEVEQQTTTQSRLERVVFCIFETKDEKAYREWLPKIFPPTSEDLAANDVPAEPETTEEASTVSKDSTSRESQTQKLRESTEDLGKDDWEAVEKPTEATSDEAVDLNEEGEKVEAVALGGSDGEEIEKPAEKQEGKAKAGTVPPVNMLAKDW